MAHDSYSDDLIASILRENTSIAMVGASANTNRPSYFAMKYLLGKGYTVVPVNVGLAGQQILGQTVYGSLAEVPPPIRIVDIFRNSEAALEVTREAIAQKDRLGIRGRVDATRRAERAGGRRGGSRRPDGDHEPLPKDRVRALVRRDRLGGRQHRPYQQRAA